ncbi:MAG: hypothetical protein CBD78_00025 [Candidatus Thioglobus sp. TMED218]|nr:MAG: hypothetical protein CBD78_00025 [Candidatus Thioglobus sp. TMED218]|tara:strand:- start:8039 stop:8482 length:444 start_codon:yes stop_codon:yes gene_type:complete
MTHVRKQIRDNVVTTLTGLSTTGTNVFRSRVYPIAENKLPGILIFTDSEEIEFGTIGSDRSQIRSLTISVQGYVKSASNYDDTLDQICVEVEEALHNDITRGGLAKDTQVINFDAEFTDDGDQPVVVGTLETLVTYVTNESNVEAAQ